MVTGGGMEGIGKDHFFSSEKLTTLLTLFKYEGGFENAIEMMFAIFNVGGKGRVIAGDKVYELDYKENNE